MTSKSLRALTVILTGAGAPGWPDIYRALCNNGERKIEIVAVDMDSDVVGYHMAPNYAVVPSGKSPEYISKMLGLVSRYSVDAIVPLTDFELLPLAKAIDKFRQVGVVIPIASAQALEIATDKILLHEFLAGENLAVPKFEVAHNLYEFERGVRTLGYPKAKVCFKPGIAHGSRGFRILNPRALESEALFVSKVEETTYSLTLERACSLLDESGNFPPLLLTEYLPGKEYSVDLLIRNNEVLCTVCRERTRIRFGLTYHGKVIDNPELAGLSANIACKVGLNYNVNIQFKCDEHGRPKILEINPRTSGTIALCWAAGINLPYLGLKLALNEPVSSAFPVIGTKSYRYWSQLFQRPDGSVFEL